jgi:5-methylcytosine-specific restriction endonuclease McrBC regulatory subunit McrC
MPPEGVIVARERRSLSISAADYRYLESHEDFWRLGSTGVVALERTGTRNFAIRGGAFVGQALIGRRLLRIEEKIPGALAALLEGAAAVDARLADVPTVAERRGRIVEHLARRYLDGLGAYLLGGRLKRYVRSAFVGALPRGKIEVAKTMRLRATGRADLLAYEADTLSADLLENRLLGLGLGALDRTVASWTDAGELLSRVRTIAVLFEDVRWPEIASWSFERLEASFAVALQDASPVLRRLLELARMFALHFGVGFRLDVEAPLAWFVNLETLFEDAVRQSIAVAARQLDPSLKVYDGKKPERYLIVAPERVYQAEPDVVVERAGNVLGVLDMKYKDLVGNPDGSDVYQILAHARAWNTTAATLVYPGDTYSRRGVGSATDGLHLAAARLNLLSLAADCELLLRNLVGMPAVAA